jgi:hypothetical protein
VALSLVSRSDARTSRMRPSSRDGLRALATAWRATQEPTMRPVAGVVPPSDKPSSAAGDESPYWPDGPSAA